MNSTGKGGTGGTLESHKLGLSGASDSSGLMFSPFCNVGPEAQRG